MKLTTVGIDLAKQVFQVHGVDKEGQVCLRKVLSRGQMTRFFANLPACLIAMEACGSAHYWARMLQNYGHSVRLISPQFVIPYRKGNKTDGNDAAAICEAVGRPDMRFVPVKDVEQQSILMLHRIRSRLVSERTALINQIRGLLGEFGVVIRPGAAWVRKGLPEILEDGENGLPDLARELFAELYEQLCVIENRVHELDVRIKALSRSNERYQRLMTLEGVGPLTATALVASVGDAHEFSNGRQFAAWLGLTPREHSSGGKYKRYGITKRGDGYLRKLLIHGARAAMRGSSKRPDKKSRWIEQLRTRTHNNVAAAALAAKHARILWAMMAREEAYKPTA